MSKLSKAFISLAGASGALAVAIGAFGAHALKESLAADMLEVFETASLYHFIHTLALLAIGLLARDIDSKVLAASGWAFVLGIVVFSGSLYVLAVTETRVLGAITPLGGAAFIAGWVLMLVAALQHE